MLRKASFFRPDAPTWNINFTHKGLNAAYAVEEPLQVAMQKTHFHTGCRKSRYDRKTGLSVWWQWLGEEVARYASVSF